jgi:hypothetical protein
MSYWRLASICQECAWFATFPPVGRDAQHNLWSIDGLRAAWPLPQNERK